MEVAHCHCRDKHFERIFLAVRMEIIVHSMFEGKHDPWRKD